MLMQRLLLCLKRKRKSQKKKSSKEVRTVPSEVIKDNVSEVSDNSDSEQEVVFIREESDSNDNHIQLKMGYEDKGQDSRSIWV